MKTKVLLSIMFAFLVIVFISCENDIPITDVTFEKEAVALKVGEMLTLNTRVFPADATKQRLRWSSSDNSIATVNDNGEVTAITKGMVEISVATNDGSQMAKCLVVVVDEPNIVMEIALHRDAELSAFIGFNLPGITVIDWGDGTEFEVTVNALRSSKQKLEIFRNLAQVAASRSNIGSHTVKVYSENIISLRAIGHPSAYQFTNLDITGVSDLIRLELSGHRFANLDISKNTKLEEITIGETQLTSLDVSNNTKLTSLDLIGNLQLTSLNLGNNNVMKFLTCHNSRLTGLDVKGLSNLIGLDISFNRLRSLDVSGLYSLRSINVPNNQLDADAFNELFRSLNNNDLGWKGIGVFDNSGNNDFDSSIAENKGWDILGWVGFGGLR